MKTNFFLSVIAVAALMTTLSSCEKDNDPIIIDSDVVETGCSDEIKENLITTPSGTDGLSLSYESWIMMRFQTRAAAGEKISVTLNNTLGVPIKEVKVNSFNFGKASLSKSYKKGETRKNGYVSITDSVLVAKVVYDNFEFDYELVYQVPVYNDGFSEEVMPYHTYGKIVLGDYSLVDMPNEQIDKVIYQCKLFKHQIVVDFAGKAYPVIASFVLKKAIGGEGDILIFAEVIDKGIEEVEANRFNSWVKIRKEYTLSEAKEFVIKTPLTHSAAVYKRDTVYHVMKNDVIIPISKLCDPEERVVDYENNLTIFEVHQSYNGGWKTKSGEAASDAMFLDLYHQRAVYKDDDIRAELPCYAYSDVKDGGYVFGAITFWKQEDMSNIASGLANLYLMDYTRKISCVFNSKAVDFSLEQSIVLLEWAK